MFHRRAQAALVVVVLGLVGLPPVAADELFDYGEYLSGECTSCHQLSGENTGIPSIVGWSEKAFIDALKAYRSGARENAAMQNVARSLGEEELSALARFFAKTE